ncbi:type II secretion system F family protein [Aeromonas salmonicida]|jgi:type II secretory pathway component PulF|uniref:type II secretion system F family protein n=1 Tax=Aeromonas salmonicida TaxID=645 RepID=UPI0012F927F5|nr:type II secretion system F family protein [Aeromonas salmonicida]
MLRKKIKRSNQLKFLKSLQFLLSLEGMVLKKALNEILKKDAGMVSDCANDILSIISDNGTIYEAFERFDDQIRSILAIGEQTNNLEGGVQSAIDFLSRDVELNSNTGFAMVMPVIMLLAQVGILILIATTILPQFESSIPKSTWPATTLFVSSLGNVLHDWWFIIIFMLLMYPMLYFSFCSKWSGEKRDAFDKLSFPLWGRYRNVSGLQFLTVLLSLLKTSSDPILLACLVSMKKHSVPYVQWHLSNMIESSGGVSNTEMASIMDTGLLNSDDLDRIKVASAGKSMVSAIQMTLTEKLYDLKIRDKQSQLLLASSVGIINTVFSVLIVFSTAPLALSVQGA